MTSPAAGDRDAIVVVRAQPRHAADIARLHARLFQDAWNAAAVSGLMARNGAISLIATDPVEAATHGFVIAQIAADEAEILSLAVAPEVQHRGIGGRMLTALFTSATAVGVTSILLEVAEDNAAAHALYQRYGFAVVGRRRGYYWRAGGRIDALLLRLALVSSAAMPAH